MLRRFITLEFYGPGRNDISFILIRAEAVPTYARIGGVKISEVGGIDVA